jgi:hypothetical protein
MIAEPFRYGSRLSPHTLCECCTMPIGAASVHKEAPMLSWSKRVRPIVTLTAVTILLGGCVTGTEVSYSEYQYDRYGGTERTYERNLYADPSRGIESERCRTVVRRRIDSFGEEVVRRERVCDPTGEIETAEPWIGRTPRRSIYSGPVEPPEDVPFVE